jgi:2-keto-4-pentenoate hydratase/2-oxohepta-3-ene-1,7-dioic acid hydratase in catechol pathway
MRLGAITRNGWPRLVEQAGGALRELDFDGDVGDLVRAAVDPRTLRPAAGPAQVAAAELRAPVRPGKIVAIGLNYHDHVREARMEVPAHPLVFAKFPSSVVGPGERIVLDPQLTERVDWEVELAVLVGRRMRAVAPVDALDYVFGYTIANDISARDVQFADGQWVRSKSLDTFCPLGPVVVTRDELPNPQDLRLRTRVNGETVQDSSTREMIFGVAELLAFCSRSFTLEPGDLVLTGTPWGCGEFMTPPRSLRPGDVVETEIDGMGVLRNPVVAGDSISGADESALPAPAGTKEDDQ